MQSASSQQFQSSAHSSQQTFQAPKPKLKRSLRQVDKNIDDFDEDVLQEEEYLNKMEKIIRRDFFPELEKLHKYQNPQEAIDEDSEELKLTLNQFTHKIKHEDSEIFKQILEREEEAWKKKIWWMFLAEKKEKYIQLALDQEPQYDNLKKIDYSNKRNRLAICPYNVQTPMFFPGKGVRTQYNTVEDNKKKKIFYENTRLEEQDEVLKEKQIQQKKEIFQQLDAFNTPALAGLRKQFTMEGKKYDLDQLQKNKQKITESEIQSSAGQKSDHIQINGYSMLSMPSPNPSQMGSPIMTYGQVEDTPIRLDNQQKQQDNNKKINYNEQFNSFKNENENQKKKHHFLMQAGNESREEAAAKLADSILIKRKFLTKNQNDTQIQKIIKQVTPKSTIRSQYAGFSTQRSQQGSKLLKQLTKMKNSAKSSVLGSNASMRMSDVFSSSNNSLYQTNSNLQKMNKK